MRPNAAAVLRWFYEHHAPLYRFAWRLTGSQPEAEDIVQECFLTMLQPGCGFDGTRPVAGAIRELPEGQREAIILAHYEEMPLAEIAAALDLEIGAVKSRIQRARVTLREKLSAFAPQQEKKS